jgi:phage protein D
MVVTTKAKGVDVEHIGIKVAGEYIDKWMKYLLRIEVDMSFYVPDMFTAIFQDDDLELMETEVFSLGKPIEITYGDPKDETKLVSLFKGEVTAIEPEFKQDYVLTYIVRGFDPSHRLSRGATSKAFIENKDSDIVKELGRAAGLSVSVDETKTVREHVVQQNESDLNFLHRLAAVNGYEVYVDGKTLHFKKAATTRGSIIDLLWSKNLTYFSPKASAAGQVDKVIVRGWDPAKKEAIVEQATSSKVHPATGFSNKKSGGDVAAAQFKSADQIEVRRPVVDPNHAKAIAQAILDEINGNFMEATGIAAGDPLLISGAQVDVQNCGMFNGKYVVTSALHIYDPSLQPTYQVEFAVSGSRPRLFSELLDDAAVSATAQQRWPGAYIGLVDNNNDPRNLGRVKVRYPWLDDQMVSGWARVAVLGGGAERGLEWTPEINDEVLVVFEQGDFDYPVVIGGLHNGKDKPGLPTNVSVKNGKVEVRAMTTRIGHKLTFTDESGKESIELIDAKGDTKMLMDMANKTIALTSKDKYNVKADGDISIEGNNITIKASSSMTLEAGSNITINAGQNVSVTAQMAATVKASTTLTLQATGNATIKGAMVAIN